MIWQNYTIRGDFVPLNEIVFAYTNAQEEVISNIPLDQEVKNELCIESFPLYPSSNFSDIPNYEGLKIFNMGNKICISYFFNGGKTDRFGRSVISAKIAIIPVNKFYGNYRDVIAIRDYLRNVRIEQSSEDEFKSYLNQNSFVSEPRRFLNFLNQYNFDFLSKSISCLINSSEVDIYYTNLVDKESFLRVVYFFLPFITLKSSSFVSECERPESGQRETYVMVPKKINSKKKIGFGAVGGLTKKFFGKNLEGKNIIHIDEQKVRSGPYINAVKAIIFEIQKDEEWYTISWDEKYLILLQLLNDIISKDKSNLFVNHGKLRKMDETLRIIKKLENI